MSSSGVDSVNSGPLIIRTYLDATANNTYVLGQYDRSIPPNRVLVTSTSGLLAPSDSIYVSSINVSTLNINSSNNRYVFTTAGSYNITVPNNATMMDFELVGGGGASYLGLGANGGYIKGRVNVTSFQNQTITIVVGAVAIYGLGGDPSFCSGASYIYKPGTALFVMAGGGGSGSSSGSPGIPLTGGAGGGGTFTNSGSNWIAIGGNGGTGGTGVGGQGGQTGGGGAAGSCDSAPGLPGDGRPMPETYQQALGGNNGGFGTVPGGSGYTGGGSGCAAGGGSSYYNSTYTYVTSSYPGNTIPSSVLPGYGRQGYGGYVSITFNNSSTTIFTNGNITCDSLTTFTINDINGSGGKSGQVLTAGTGNQVVWSNLPLQSGTAQLFNPIIKSTVTTSYNLTTSSIIQLSWYNDNNVNCDNPIYTSPVPGVGNLVKQVWWNLSTISTNFDIEIGPNSASAGHYHLIKWALLGL